MPDVMQILITVLAVATVVMAYQYYKVIRRTHKEYEKAREAVEDIIVSFDRQFKREDERLEFVAYKIEGLVSKSDGAMNKASDVEKRLQGVEAKVVVLGENEQKLSLSLNETDGRVRDVVASQETVMSKITSLEDQAKRLPPAFEANVEAVIPIRRDKALAPLTTTELAALEFLASEGSKTAPEIKWKVRLSREHTARLMKKLYESGYLERDTNKIPFRYSVKKEMEKLLRKTENQAN